MFLDLVTDLSVNSLSNLDSTVTDGDSTIGSIDTNMDSVGNGPAPFHPKSHGNQTQSTLTPPIILYYKTQVEST